MTTTAALTSYQQHLIDWATKEAKKRGNGWPGFPLSQLPLVAKPDLDLLVSRGLLRLVEQAGRTNPNSKHVYVCPGLRHMVKS